MHQNKYIKDLYLRLGLIFTISGTIENSNELNKNNDLCRIMCIMSTIGSFYLIIIIIIIMSSLTYILLLLWADSHNYLNNDCCRNSFINFWKWWRNRQRILLALYLVYSHCLKNFINIVFMSKVISNCVFTLHGNPGSTRTSFSFCFSLADESYGSLKADNFQPSLQWVIQTEGQINNCTWCV